MKRKVNQKAEHKDTRTKKDIPNSESYSMDEQEFMGTLTRILHVNGSRTPQAVKQKKKNPA